jgi:hypothetical protein
MFKFYKNLIFVLVFVSIVFCTFASADYTADYLKKEYKNRIANFIGRYYVNKNYIPEVNVVNIYDEPVTKTKIIISLYFDETQFSDTDLDFIKSVIISQIGLDLTKGNTITLYRIPFTKDVFNLDVLKKSIQNIKFNKPVISNFDMNNFYFYGFCILLVVLFIGLLVVLFFIFYLINMNKKMDLLILNKLEESKRNILIDRSEYQIKDKEEKEYDFVDMDSSKEKVEKKENIDKKIKKKTSKESNKDILNILKDIENLNKNNTKNEQNIIKENEKFEKNFKKIQFEEIEKLSEKLLYFLLKEYDLNVLAVAIFKMNEDFQNKIFQSLSYSDKQSLISEIEKLEKFNTLTAETILAMRQKIVDDINILITQGKIDLTKFIS